MKHLITLSKTAMHQCHRILENSNKKYLLLSLKSGGCSGFEYQFQTVDSLNMQTDVHQQEGLDIHICKKSILFLLGTRIDWKTDIMGTSFHFLNPNANQTCGCGSSFDPKDV